MGDGCVAYLWNDRRAQFVPSIIFDTLACVAGADICTLPLLPKLHEPIFDLPDANCPLLSLCFRETNVQFPTSPVLIAQFDQMRLSPVFGRETTHA